MGGSKQAHQPRYRSMFRAVSDLNTAIVAVTGDHAQRLMILMGGVFSIIGAVISIIGIIFGSGSVSRTPRSVSFISIIRITEGRARLPFGHLTLVANCRLPAEVSW